jgi:hypothetical protein
MDEIKVEQRIGVEQIRKATQILQKYKSGKQNLENKIENNEKWYRQRHWDFMVEESTAGDPKPASGWLFNTIQSKHADFMDSFPKSNILPREQGDLQEAHTLASIIPVIMEQNDYESEYSDEVSYKLKNGTGVFGVFWNQEKLNGLGDIDIKSMDLLQLFWEPGVKDIQKSQNFFSVELVDNSVLEEEYPQCKGKLKSGDDSNVTLKKYYYDENIDTTGKSAVIDWYYHKKVNGKNTLQYCKYVDEIILYATENDTQPKMDIVPVPMTDAEGNEVLNEEGKPYAVPQEVPVGPSVAERGLYDHGKYPFIFDVLFKEEGMPVGFGFVDICKNAQTSIDIFNNTFEKNAQYNANPRYFVRQDAGVKEEELADPNQLLVHVSGNLGENSIRPVDQTGLNGNYMTLLDNKVNEMKETSGNRDTSNGGTTSGVTAASAIAAMQEQAGKTSRDMIKTTYRAHREVVNLVIELIRQFYDMPRTFRITGETGQEEYVTYSNQGLQPQSLGNDYGVEQGYRLPVFDIKVTAEKESPYSQLSQNELALQFYGNGFFNPELADQALACIDMMEFPGKDRVVQKIQANGTMYQMILQMQQQMLQMSQVIDAQNGTTMADQMAAGILNQPQVQPGNVDADIYTGNEENSIVSNARERAASSTEPR